MPSTSEDADPTTAVRKRLDLLVIKAPIVAKGRPPTPQELEEQRKFKAGVKQLLEGVPPENGLSYKSVMKQVQALRNPVLRQQQGNGDTGVDGKSSKHLNSYEADIPTKAKTNLEHMSNKYLKQSTVDTSLWNQMTMPFRSQALHGKGSEKSYTPKRTAKIDRQGNFLPFPNITTVCHIDHGAYPHLHSLPEKLCKLAGQYLTPLPSSSYHATVLSGPIRNHDPQNWDATMRHPCWEQLARYLNQISYAPTDLVIDKVLVKKSFGVTVYLRELGVDKKAQAIPAGNQSNLESPYTSGNDKDPVNSSDDTTKLPPSHLKLVRTELRDLVPDGMMDSREQRWHVTIAYPNFAGGVMPDDVQALVVEAVGSCFSFRDEAGGSLPFADQAVRLLPARLCLSPDMTLFEPWDGVPCESQN